MIKKKLIYPTLLMFLFVQSCMGLEGNSRHPISIYNGVYLELAEALNKEDTIEIENIFITNKIVLDYSESNHGISLLNWCILNNKRISFEKLLKLGANVNWQDLYYKFPAPMIESARCDNMEFLKLAIKYNGNVNLLSKKMSGSEDQSPLFAAIYSNNIENIRFLIRQGANVNLTQDKFWTPLAETLIHDKIRLAKLLIDNGADYNNLQFKVRSIKLDSVGHEVKNADGTPCFIDGKELNILDFLRDIQFPLNSTNYRIKMQIVDFLKAKGLDYWNYPIPDYIKKQHQGDNNYLINY